MSDMRKKPKFSRQSSRAYKRLGEKWRKPRGLHSKLRRREKSKGKWPSASYGSSKEFRSLHPSGFAEILIFNMKDLERLNPEKNVAKIASVVGKKKRIEIAKKAEEMKIKVLNP